MTIVDGLVHLAAHQATIAEVLAEWERVGQTRVVNADQLGPERVTLQLSGVPEGQALDILLRAAGGYLAAERTDRGDRLSRFQQILVLPAGPPQSGATRPSSANTASVAPVAPPVAPPAPVPSEGVTNDGREGSPWTMREAAPSPQAVAVDEEDDLDGRPFAGAERTGRAGLSPGSATPTTGGSDASRPGLPTRTVIGTARPGLPTAAPAPSAPAPDPNGRF